MIFFQKVFAQVNFHITFATRSKERKFLNKIETTVRKTENQVRSMSSEQIVKHIRSGSSVG
ncbi:MAG: hypothetical protein CL843_07135 [Crocinitomicaceae bacterium]|nr:hypothetical protein [Crocinitomicaceae bacterium]